MTSRRLRGIAEQAESLQQEIITLEKLVRLKDDIDQINDCAFAQRNLFPNSLELWRKIVAAQIQLYKLREKEKVLKKQIEKDRNHNIDFSILNKYRRYKKPVKPEEKATEDVKPEKRRVVKESVREEPPGFMIRFRLSNAYDAIERQEQVLTRPQLTPYMEKITQSGPVCYYFNRKSKTWKRCDPCGSINPVRSSSNVTEQIVDPRGLSLAMQQAINAINKRNRLKNRNDMFGLPERDIPSKQTVHEDIIEENAETFAIDNLSELTNTTNDDLSESKAKSTTSQSPTTATVASKVMKAVQTLSIQPSSKHESKRVERLKHVASQMNALHDQLNSMKDDGKLDGLTDDEEMFKTCKYLYRLPHCKCVANPLGLLNEDILKQIAGSIDILDHSESGHAVGNVECDYCMKLPRSFIRNWLATLRTGETQGVYGAERYNWFPDGVTMTKKGY